MQFLKRLICLIVGHTGDQYAEMAGAVGIKADKIIMHRFTLELAGRDDHAGLEVGVCSRCGTLYQTRSWIAAQKPETHTASAAPDRTSSLIAAHVIHCPD